MKVSCGLLAACVGLGAAAIASAAGPDVIVSTVGPTLTRYGTNNGITGYAVTTVSCNIGDANAIWIDSTSLSNPQRNKHPVIGQQMYRLYQGRFEQIGMSWLKHGFCAADAPNCVNLAERPGAAYAPNSSCDWLGLYATDTYSAGLNAAQASLGPRSEINAATGVFPYPYQLAWNATGNCTYKRLQIANEDLDPSRYPGARYFVEVHYIPTDEAGDVRYNNASYRECTVSSQSSAGSGCTSDGLGFNLVFPSNLVTIPKQPAIMAWATADPSVQLTIVDIPNDGRVIIGSKVTNLNNGTWAYEYAVYNHNSDRSIGSFSIPKASSPNATFTNLGFHDVPYHSGEPFDGTDWSAQITPGNVTWSTTPFATNPNANAIRWSTTYNFRLTSNQPPMTSREGNAINLGLFKDGLPGDLTTISISGVTVPSIPCPADINHDGNVSVQDVFDFIALFAVSDPGADFNGVDNVTVQDLFDFVGAFFGGC